MPWLTPSQEPTLAELASRASISGGGGISSALLRPPPNQWEELLKTVAPVIKDYIQKQKSDEIANQLLRDTGAPKQYQDQGAQGLQAWTQLNKFQQNESMGDLQYQAAYRKAYPEQFPEASDNRAMTEYQREQTRLREMSLNQREQRQRVIPEYSRAIARGKLDNKGEFTNNYEGAESGEFARVLTPKGDLIVVPWSAYEQSQNPAAEMYGGAQQEVQSGGGEPPTPAYVPTPPESFAKPGTSPTSSAPIKVNTPEEALKLPSGTIFQTPDGRIKRRP